MKPANDFEDELLKVRSTHISNQITEFNPYVEGLRILVLSEQQVKNYGDFLSDFYQKRRKKYKNKQITRTAPTMIKGAIFAVGTEKQKNPEWKEHCATSLREIFHEWKESEMKSDFINLYRNQGPKLSNNEEAIFDEFKLHYDYFCGVDHHEASRIMGSLTAILKDTTLKLEHCYKDEIFISRVKNFFLILAQIIEISKK